MATYEPRRCYVCDKIFCCVDCCEEHIKKKHSTRHTITDCPLCRREPLTVRNFDLEQLKNHVVFNHLPLQCLKCGELFEKHEDLKYIGTCDRHPIIRIEPPTLTELCVTSLSSSSLEATSGVTKTPLNSSLTKHKSLSFSGDYQQFEDSPREFTRHTSTPMHVGLTKQLNLSNININNISGKSGNFFFKTLKRPVVPIISITSSSDKSININNNNKNSSINFNSPEIISQDNIKKSNLSNFERTPLRSILSSKSFNKDSSNQSGSLFKNLSERRLEAMMELNDESDNNNNKEVPDSVGGLLEQDDSLNSENKKRRDSKDSNKRVRFSDEFNLKLEDDNLTDDNDKEEFFESCQSFSDTSVSSTEKIQSSDGKFVGENASDVLKENKENIAQPGCSGSSRVVMMVLLEKSGEVYPRDLAPIIDSSLEKLKTAITGSNDQLAATCISQEAIDNCQSGFAMLSVDSYTKVSTVECVKNSDSASSYSSCLRKNQGKENNSKGIFASVANAVKSVFKNISGSSKNTSTLEPNSPERILQDWSSIDSCESAITSLSRASKRPREEIEFLPCSSSSYSSDSSIDYKRGSRNKEDEDNNKSTPNNTRSPAVKKARGWYNQVRPREPISRMKNSSSSTPLPRGVSFETQCFQQGALTTKDAILPLPDRAQVNRSTQTDF
ncbi:mitosis initiation protein fs(1)Ya [Cotesia glomerata]|uniref:mitosis initiation protein fs(1)Ya n=1 Tax=Cotesia glomerata TaxID=32391 RepID=UPI001D017C7D|nr:mitosis initiation protein fs(1)Ya [Cotesia glomerata]